MSEIAQKTAIIMDMLPDKEQALAFEMLKRIVLAWDPDFTKVTDAEAEAIKRARSDFESGNTVSHEDIDWD